MPFNLSKHCIPIQHISFKENFLLLSINNLCKDGPNFSSINTIYFFVFPDVINFGIPKSLNVYKFTTSSSKYDSVFERDSNFIVTGVLFDKQVPS